MNQTIQTSRPVSTAFELKLLKALDKAGAEDRGEYLVVHPDDLPQLLETSIREQLWAFHPQFLAEATRLPEEVYTGLQANDRCEVNNPVILKLVEVTCGLAEIVRKTEDVDGAGHYLATYDSEEIELPIVTGRTRKLWSAYRTN